MDPDIIQQSLLFAWLNEHADYILWAIIIMAFAECFAIVGIFIPGVVLLTIGGFAAGLSEINIWWVLICTYVGGGLGNATSYWLGYYVRGGRFFQAMLDWEWVVKMEKFTRSYGWLAVFAARFIGPLRPVAPFVAGTMGMRLGLFLFVDMLSGFLWAPIYILPGYFIGNSMNYPQIHWQWIALGGVILICIGILLYIVRHRFFVLK